MLYCTVLYCSLMITWEGPESLLSFYEQNGGLLVLQALGAGSKSTPSTIEAAAIALHAAVRRDPLSALRARQNGRGPLKPGEGASSFKSNSSPMSTSSSTATTPTTQAQDTALQLRLQSVLDLMTCSYPAVQTHLVTILGLLVPFMNSVVLSEVLECGLIFMLCSLYVAPPCIELRIAAMRTTNALLRLTLTTKELASIGATIIRALLSGDVCDVISGIISNFSVGVDISSSSRKEELLEAVTLLDRLTTQPNARSGVSPWVTQVNNTGSNGTNNKEYPVTAADTLLAMLATYARAGDELVNQIIVKISDIASLVAVHCTSRTLFLNGTSFAASCITIACDSPSDLVVYHSLAFLSCMAYLPSFAQPLLISQRHTRLCERALHLAVPSATSNLNISNPLFFRSATDVLLYILYQTAATSTLWTVSGDNVEGVEEGDDWQGQGISWEGLSLFLLVAQCDELWANMSMAFGPKESSTSFPSVFVLLIHVLAGYKNLEVLEALWGQLQKHDITQHLLNLGATQVTASTMYLLQCSCKQRHNFTNYPLPLSPYPP